MANSYSKLLYHCIWSTKGRAALIHQDIEERVWAYMAGIAARNSMHALRIGGIENHVHLLVEIPRTVSVSDAMKWLKGGVSAWINEEHLIACHFSWQDGFGAFSVSASNCGRVAHYISRQREHHRTRSFEEEYRSLFRRHGVEVDEKYLFDD